MGFKDYLKERGIFTDAEKKVSDTLCEYINGNKDLKFYFSSFVTDLLKVFLKEIREAQNKGSKELAQESAEKAGDKIRAITTYLYVKVSMRKEVK